MQKNNLFFYIFTNFLLMNAGCLGGIDPDSEQTDSELSNEILSSEKGTGNYTTLEDVPYVDSFDGLSQDGNLSAITAQDESLTDNYRSSAYIFDLKKNKISRILRNGQGVTLSPSGRYYITNERFARTSMLHDLENSTASRLPFGSHSATFLTDTLISYGEANSIFVYDLKQQRSVLLVDTKIIGNNFKISIDSNYIAFTSGFAVVSGIPAKFGKMYLYDRNKKQTIFIGQGRGICALGCGPDPKFSISADGQYIAYEAVGINIYNRLDNTTKSIARDGYHQEEPSISADGQYIVYTAYLNTTQLQENGYFENVFVYDRDTATHVLVTTKLAGINPPKPDVAAGTMSSVRISANGKHIGFLYFEPILLSGNAGYTGKQHFRNVPNPLSIVEPLGEY